MDPTTRFDAREQAWFGHALVKVCDRLGWTCSLEEVRNGLQAIITPPGGCSYIIRATGGGDSYYARVARGTQEIVMAPNAAGAIAAVINIVTYWEIAAITGEY